MPCEEIENSFEGHSLQFKQSLGMTSLWSILALEASKLHGGSSNAVLEGECLNTIEQTDGLVCRLSLVL